METVFIGNFNISLDKKNRMTIPSMWKTYLGDEIVITKGYDGCLVIRNLYTFNKYCQETLKSDEKNKDNRALRRATLGNSQFIKLDSWSRFVIPQQFFKLINLSEEIVLVGVGDVIELWNSEDFSKWLEDEENGLEKVSQRLSTGLTQD